MIRFEDDRYLFDVLSPLILEASAGSGKTTALVERYVASLIYQVGVRGKSPAESVASITAITFTKKAAAEMKDRIVRVVAERFGSNEDVAAFYEGFKRFDCAGGVSPGAFAERCLAAKDEIVESLGFARIATIHSFGLRILRGNPVETKIDPDASPDDRPDGNLTSSEKDAFYLAHRKLIDSRDKDFSFLVGSLGYAKTSSLLESLHFVCESYGAQFVEESARRHGYFRFENIAGNAGRIFEALKPFVERLDADLHSLRAVKEIKADKSLAEAVRRFWDDKGLTAFQIAWDYVYKPGKDDDLNALREAVKVSALTVTAAVNALLFAPLWNCCRVVESEIRRARTDRKVVTFDEIERLLLDALRSNETFRRNAAGSVDFLLIDEYQDTSEIQFEIFNYFLRNPGTTTFAVGDPKQSVYRFRNASVETFEKTKKLLVDKFGEKSSGRLEKNYRSDPEIVRRVNRIFSELMKDSPEGIVYSPQKPSREDSAPGAGFYFLGAVDEKAENVRRDIAGQTARLISRLIDAEGFAPCDILVLARQRKIISPFNAEMDDLNASRAIPIPYVNNDPGSVPETTEIAWIMNYLRALDHPESDYRMLSLLKTPFFRKHDGDVLNMMRDTENMSGGRIHEWMKKNGGVEFALFEEFRRQKNRLTIADLVREIVEKTGYRAFLNTLPHKNEASTNLIVLLDELRRIQDMEVFDLTSFLYRAEVYGFPIAKPQIVGERSNVVRVMTVHAAKGLEAPVVIFMATGKGRGGGAKPPFLIEASTGTFGCAAAGADKTYREIGTASEAKDAEEEKRLAYVAFTRAAGRFYYVGLSGGESRYKDGWAEMFDRETPGIFEDFRSFDETLAATKDYCRSSAAQTVPAMQPEPPAERLTRLSDYRETFRVHPETITITQLLDIEFEKAAFPNKYLLKSFPVVDALSEVAEDDIFTFENSATDMGTFLHAVFERSDADDYEAFIRRALDAEAGGLAASEAELIKLAKKFYEGDFYRGFVLPAVRSESEWEVNFPVETPDAKILLKGSIDKYLVLPDGRGVLVDYKLGIGSHTERYARQLNYYASILHRLGYAADEAYLYDIREGKAVGVELNVDESAELMARHAAEIAGQFTKANPLSNL